MEIGSLGHLEKEAVTTLHATLPNLTRKTVSCLLLAKLLYTAPPTPKGKKYRLELKYLYFNPQSMNNRGN